MEDRKQLLHDFKPQGENEPELRRGISDSIEYLTCRSVPPAATASPNASASGSIPCATPGSSGSNDCSECLSGVAHRLSQTMTALRGGIELGLMGKHSATDYRSLLEQSLHLADEMSQMIVTLRDLGEAGAAAGPPQHVLLETTVAAILLEMEGLAQARGLRLQFRTRGTMKIRANSDRLREALQSLLVWVIQNSSDGGVIAVDLLAAEGEALMRLSAPRFDSQYFQIKALEDIPTPGFLFSHAAKSGSLAWVICQRMVDGLGGRLEMITDGHDAGRIRVRFPLVPAG